MKLKPEFATILLLASMLLGCGTANQDALIEQRAKYVLNQEPAGALGVIEAKSPEADLENLVVVGRVGGTHETWDKGKAAFVISDPSVDHEHAEQSGHDPDNCPFCKAKRKGEKILDPTAIVQIKGGDDQVLAYDARDLLKIEEGQLVVVKGAGSIDSVGNLVIAATGVFVRE